jgi:hypothetical protein
MLIPRFPAEGKILLPLWDFRTSQLHTVVNFRYLLLVWNIGCFGDDSRACVLMRAIFPHNLICYGSFDRINLDFIVHIVGFMNILGDLLRILLFAR